MSPSLQCNAFIHLPKIQDTKGSELICCLVVTQHCDIAGHNVRSLSTNAVACYAAHPSSKISALSNQVVMTGLGTSRQIIGDRMAELLSRECSSKQWCLKIGTSWRTPHSIAWCSWMSWAKGQRAVRALHWLLACWSILPQLVVVVFLPRMVCFMFPIPSQWH